MSILEAMASQVPVIATSVGGVPEIIKTNDMGILCESNNAAMLAESIKRLIDDQPLRGQLASKAYDHIKENYSLDRMYQSYKTIYEKVLIK